MLMMEAAEILILNPGSLGALILIHCQYIVVESMCSHFSLCSFIAWDDTNTYNVLVVECLLC
jgi:hypothetical protein